MPKLVEYGAHQPDISTLDPKLAKGWNDIFNPDPVLEVLTRRLRLRHDPTSTPMRKIRRNKYVSQVPKVKRQIKPKLRETPDL